MDQMKILTDIADQIEEEPENSGYLLGSVDAALAVIGLPSTPERRSVMVEMLKIISDHFD